MTWERYTVARVRVMSPSGVVEVRSAPISQVVGHFPDPIGRTIHIITAHNPNGRDRSSCRECESPWAALGNAT